MSVLSQIFQMILSCVCPAVLLFIGLYFKGHVKSDVGQSGFVSPSANKTLEGWLYAQIIGPKMTVSFGKAALATTFLVDVLVLLFGISPENMVYFGNIVGFGYVIALLLNVEGKVKDFLDGELFVQDDDTRRAWILKVREMIEKEQYARALRFVESNCYDSETMKAF